MFQAYFSVTLLVTLFLVSFFLGILPFLYSKCALLTTFLLTVPLPKWILTPKIVDWICQGISDYFKHEIHFEEELPEKAIYSLMPHGVIPFSLPCVRKYFPDTTIVTAHQVYYFPVLNHVLSHLGGIPANYQQMRASLDQRSLLLYPGGVRELFQSHHKKERIVIKKRKGIFRLALETGTPLVPVYTFGLNSLYHRSGISLTPPFLFQNERDSVAWYFGKWYSPFPMRKKLITVVGRKIPVEKEKCPTTEKIILLRKKYISSVKNLFHKWKKIYGWEKRRLYVH